MAYDIELADRVRYYLADHSALRVTEKAMFRGLAFLVDGKMCVNISGENLMCRIDPDQWEQLSGRRGFMSLRMRGKELKGYCYVTPEGFRTKKDFEFWMDLCLEFNPRAKASPKKSRNASGIKNKKATAKKAVTRE